MASHLHLRGARHAVVNRRFLKVLLSLLELELLVSSTGSVQVDEIEPEVVLAIGVVEFESARIPVIHGDAVHAHD